ncbi:alpha/beta fold hydrolase [Qipengyuania sp. CAU 1752]
MQKDQQSSVSEIISSIYASALRPELYLEFSKAWERGVIAPILQGSRESVPSRVELEQHFRLALKIFETAKMTRRQSIQDFLDAQNFASAIVRADGTLIASNAQFRDRFQLQAKGSVLDRIERLVTADAGGLDNGKKSVWPAGEDVAVAARYHFADGGKDIVILEKLQDEQFTQPADGEQFLVKSCQAGWTTAGAKILERSFDLTSAELEIAKELYAGLQINEIAQHRSRAIGTVRKQVKSLLTKADAHHQSELIGLITGIMHVVAAKPDDHTVSYSTAQLGDQFQSTTILDLPDTRRLQYEHYGHAQGLPVLFLHGHTSSAEPTQHLVDCAAEARLRIIAPYKPGLRQTSADDGLFEPMAFIEDCLRVLDSLGIERIPIAGHAMSGVYAIHAAAKFPDRFSSVALLDTGIPLVKEEQFLQMPEGSRRIFHTAWHTPELLYAPFAFAGETFAQSEEHEHTVMKSQFAESKHDSKLLLSPRYYRPAKNAMADFFSTPRRSVDELIYWVTDWTKALLKVADSSPVLFIHSQEHDWLPYQEVAEFCAKNPNLECVVVENTAQLLFYEKSDLLFQAIRMSCSEHREPIAAKHLV